MLATSVRRVKVWGGSNNMRVVQSIPALPTLPSKDWCEEHDAIEYFWDNIIKTKTDNNHNAN